jgi:hypothetical protein
MAKKGLIRKNILRMMVKANKPVKSKDLADMISDEIKFNVTNFSVGQAMEDLVICGKVVRYKLMVKYRNRMMKDTSYTYELNKGIMGDID